VYLPPTGTPFEWLISPTPTEAFFRDYWEKRALVVQRGQPAFFGSLLSLDEVDRVLTTLDLKYPNVTLKNADRSVTADDYTVEGDSLDVAKVYQLFEAGSTITLAFLENVVPTLTALCRGLEAEFSSPLQSNVYLTPPGAQGAQPHYDSHDVFVLQIAGSKAWRLYGTPVELPLRGQDFDPARHPLGPLAREFELQAGDVAYIPRGLVHDARSGNEVSLHITVGVLSYTWCDLLLEWVANASLNDSRFRKALPPGFARHDFDKSQARAMLDDLVARLSAASNLGPILDRFSGEFLSSCPPLLRGQMAQITNLDRLTIESVAGARPAVIAQVSIAADSIAVECYGRTITFPPHAAEAVQFTLSRPEYVVRDLPGNLDDEGKLTLIRRLVREGLVVVRQVGS
jgi:ribosomal protein L16 Arg81 hydroxylase